MDTHIQTIPAPPNLPHARPACVITHSATHRTNPIKPMFNTQCRVLCGSLVSARVLACTPHHLPPGHHSKKCVCVCFSLPEALLWRHRRSLLRGGNVFRPVMFEARGDCWAPLSSKGSLVWPGAGCLHGHPCCGSLPSSRSAHLYIAFPQKKNARAFYSVLLFASLLQSYTSE